MRTFPAPHPFCWAEADCMTHPVAALLSPSVDTKVVFTTLVCERHARAYLGRIMEGAEDRIRALTAGEIERIKTYEETPA